jgi:hypothetical protein
MEDLWKLKSLDWQVDELAETAVYRTLVRRFHDEEVRNNTRDLLYPPPEPRSDDRHPEH